MSAHHQMNEHSETERGESQGRGARGRGGRGGCGRQLGGVSNTGVIPSSSQEGWPGSSLRSRCRRIWSKWFFFWYTAPSFRRFRWSCLESWGMGMYLARLFDILFCGVSGGYPVFTCIHRLPSRLDKRQLPRKSSSFLLASIYFGHCAEIAF